MFKDGKLHGLHRRREDTSSPNLLTGGSLSLPEATKTGRWQFLDWYEYAVLCRETVVRNKTCGNIFIYARPLSLPEGWITIYSIVI